MAEFVTTDQVEDRFFQLMRLHRYTMHRYFQSIGLFNGHPHMLFHIRRRPGITQKELAAHLEISAASVAISIRRLEAAGLVRRESDDTDRRVMHLYLTPAGEEMDAACGRGREFMIDTLYRGLSPDEQAVLYDLLGKMTANLQNACDRLPAQAPQEEGDTL